MSFVIHYKYNTWNKKFEQVDTSVKDRLSPWEDKQVDLLIEELNTRPEFLYLATNAWYVGFLFLLIMTTFMTLYSQYPILLISFIYLFTIVGWRYGKLKKLRLHLDEKYLEWKAMDLNLEWEVDFTKEAVPG